MSDLTKEQIPNIKPVIAISLLTAACLVGDSMLYIVLPTHWQEAGLSSLWEVGVLLSINRLVRLPLNPIVGWLYQKQHISSRIGVLLATILAVLTTASYGLLQGFWFLLAMRCIWGVAWTFLRLGAYFTILDYASDDNRGHFMGTYNGLFRLGSLVGMLAGGLLADAFGLRTAAIVFATVTACSIPCIFWSIPKNQTQGATINAVQTTTVLKQWSVIWALLTGTVIAMIYQGLFTSTLSHLIKSLYAETVTVGGLMIGAASLGGVLQAIRWSWEPWLAPWFGRRSDGVDGRRVLLTSTLLLSTMLFAALPFQLPIVLWLVMLLLLQLTATILTTLSDAVVSDVAAVASKSVVMTAYSFTIDLGAAIGPLAAYLINQAFGIEYTYWFAAAIMGLLSLKWLAPHSNQ